MKVILGAFQYLGLSSIHCEKQDTMRSLHLRWNHSDIHGVHTNFEWTGHFRNLPFLKWTLRRSDWKLQVSENMPRKCWLEDVSLGAKGIMGLHLPKLGPDWPSKTWIPFCTFFCRPCDKKYAQVKSEKNFPKSLANIRCKCRWKQNPA